MPGLDLDLFEPVTLSSRCGQPGVSPSVTAGTHAGIIRLRRWVGGSDSPGPFETAASPSSAMQGNFVTRLVWAPKHTRWVGNQAGHLPYVDCEHCGQRCGGVDYPLIPATDFPECPQEWDYEDKGMAVTWKEFQELTARSRRLYGDGWELMPGSTLGPIDILPEGRAPLEFADVEWSSPGGVLFNWGCWMRCLPTTLTCPIRR